MDLLEKVGLSYEDLNAVERETYHQWLDSLQKNKITIEGVKKYIERMRVSVEEELTNDNMKRFSFWSFLFRFKKEHGLKSRLRNYMLLEGFLDSPERAKKALEQALTGVKKTS